MSVTVVEGFSACFSVGERELAEVMEDPAETRDNVPAFWTSELGSSCLSTRCQRAEAWRR
jgi:hypothetical protein